MADINAATKFLEKGQQLIGGHPDFNETLQKADDYGLTISPAAVAEIVRLGVPEVAYFLAKPENFEAAHSLMNLDSDKQVVEVRRLSKQLEESGFARDPDTEDWIDARRQARREGKRR